MVQHGDHVEWALNFTQQPDAEITVWLRGEMGFERNDTEKAGVPGKYRADLTERRTLFVKGPSDNETFASGRTRATARGTFTPEFPLPCNWGHATNLRA